MNLKKLQKIIEGIGEELRPEDNWMPALILEGKKSVTVYGFIGKPMDEEFAKDMVARKITECIAAFKPDVACFITTAWSLDLERVSEDEVDAWRLGRMGKVAEHPNRIEIVDAYVYGVTGSNKGEALMMGYIERSPDKSPRIKQWQIYKEGVSTEGRWPEAIKQGFQLAGLAKGGQHV